MIIKTHHLYTMEGDGVGYHCDNSIVIDDGKIVKIAPFAEIEREYVADKVIDARDRLVLPGLIDGHMHTTSSALRGLGQDVSNWMMHGVGPFLDFADRDTRAASGKMGIVEAIMNGTTTIGDEGPFQGPVCEFINEIGVRGNIGCRVRSAKVKVYAPGELYEYDQAYSEETFNEAAGIFEKWHGRNNGRIRVMFAPQGADFVSEEMLQLCHEMAVKHNSFMYMHYSQGSRETKQMLMRYGVRTVEFMKSRGLLDEHLIGVHFTNATDEEVRQTVEAGGRMVLCSASIGLIDGIVPPAKVFQDCGGYVALGTDQANGNNEHNMFNEMRMTAMFNKIKYEDPEVMPCWKVLRMCTIESAKALGIDDAVGSLEPGKDADIIFVDLNRPSMNPVYSEPMRNLIPNLVYGACGRDVNTVIAAGRILVDDHKPVAFRLEDIIAEAQAEAERLAPKAAPKFWEINGVNAQYMKDGKL